MRYAVVFKTYSWDAFVHRQALRCEAAAGAGDFFIAADETNGSLGPLPFKNVVRTTNAELVETGLANRSEKGGLLWWNPDYVHYRFQELNPGYDFYVFVEYDVVVQGSLQPLVESAWRDAVDLIALPIRFPLQNWFWWLFHQQTYPVADIRGSLNCVSVFSGRALALLSGRRREMADGSTPYWPSSEVFIPTEIERAGYRYRSLAEFGDVKRYDWFPPLLEEDLSPTLATTFLHPVLDRSRYVPAMLRSTHEVGNFFNPRSELRQRLARLPPEDYRHLLAGAARARFKVIASERVARAKLRMFLKLRSKRTTPSPVSFRSRLGSFLHLRRTSQRLTF